MTHYYVTWQPDIVEAGDYFLTHIESNRADLDVVEIMSEVFKLEEVTPLHSFELCSILRVDGTGGPAVVLH